MPPEGHPDSYYVSTAAPLPDHPKLEGAASADVCVVGGGFTGVSAALHLAERGYQVILLEAARIGAGASGRNGGQVGTGQRVPQATLETMVGAARARLLFDLAEEAKRTVKERIARHRIASDLKPGILMAAWKPADVAPLRRNTAHLNEAYGYPHARFVPRDEMAAMLGTGRYHGGALDSDGAHLHPLNYVLGLAGAAAAAGAQIFERSRVIRIDQGARPKVVTAAGEVRCRHLVLAMNGLIGKLANEHASRIMPINNFIIATEPLGEERARALIRDDVAVADTKFVIDYYRLSADRRLLFGGGESYRRTFPADIARFVRPVMLRVFPQLESARIDFAWGGTLAITRSRLPHFARAGEVFIAHGYSGHGVAMATFAGKLIAEAVAGTAERFDVMADLAPTPFPGGTLFRLPMLAAGMTWYALRDRL
ncbi:MAG: FAD-binding oxidoreductase [Geminicoccaceae bacterium]|nr:FAD-binding oxidoreductase [Geminicoccaceae bacterium]